MPSAMAAAATVALSRIARSIPLAVGVRARRCGRRSLGRLAGVRRQQIGPHSAAFLRARDARDPLDLAEQLAQVAAGSNAPSAFSNELRSLLAYCDWPPSTSTSNSILRRSFRIVSNSSR